MDRFSFRSLPNLSGLSLHAAAPTQDYVTLNAKQAARLNAERGREPLTFADYDEAKSYFSLPRPDDGRYSDAFDSYEYFDAEALHSWVKTRNARGYIVTNPKTGEKMAGKDIRELLDIRREQQRQERERQEQQRREEESQRLGMTLEQYDAYLERQRQALRLHMSLEQYDAYLKRQEQARQERRERLRQARQRREDAEAEAELRAREWEAGRDAGDG